MPHTHILYIWKFILCGVKVQRVVRIYICVAVYGEICRRLGCNIDLFVEKKFLIKWNRFDFCLHFVQFHHHIWMDVVIEWNVLKSTRYPFPHISGLIDECTECKLCWFYNSISTLVSLLITLKALGGRICRMLVGGGDWSWSLGVVSE